MIKLIENNKYLKLDEMGEHLKAGGNYYSHGIGANGIGGLYIRLTNIIETTERVLKNYNQTNLQLIELCKVWKNDNTHDNYYKSEFERLETKNDNSYKFYYENVNAILSSDEIEEIQKEINFDFISFKFYNKMIEKVNAKINELDKEEF